MKDLAIHLGMNPPSQKAVEKEFKKLDIDKSGNIDYDEFKVFAKEAMIKVIENM